LDGSIEKETYLAKKDELIKTKTDLNRRRADFGRKGNNWIVSFPYEEVRERTKITPESQQRLDWNSSVMSARVSTVRASGFLRY